MFEDPPENEQPLNLATCSYGAFHPDMGVPIRTTVGLVRRFAWPLLFVSELAPYGLLKVNDHDEFEERYRARLDGGKGDMAVVKLALVQEEYPGQTLVLLCFEDVHAPDQWCHRTIAAQWLSEKLGIDVPEVSPVPHRHPQLL